MNAARQMASAGMVACALALSLTACNAPSTNNQDIGSSSEPSQQNEGAGGFETVATSSSGRPESLEEADELSFDLVSMGSPSDGEMRALFDVTSKHGKQIDLVEMYFSYRDANGNEITSDYYSNSYGMDEGGSARIASTAHMDSGDVPNVSDVVVTRYSYVSEGVQYQVNFDISSFDFWTDSREKTDFGKADVLSFAYEDLGYTSADVYQVSVDATNTGERPVTEINISNAFFNADDVSLGTGGGYLDTPLDAGGSAAIQTGMLTEDFDGDIASFGIHFYTYETPTEDGYDRYMVDLKNQKATVEHITDSE